MCTISGFISHKYYILIFLTSSSLWMKYVDIGIFNRTLILFFDLEIFVWLRTPWMSKHVYNLFFSYEDANRVLVLGAAGWMGGERTRVKLFGADSWRSVCYSGGCRHYLRENQVRTTKWITQKTLNNRRCKLSDSYQFKILIYHVSHTERKGGVQ